MDKARIVMVLAQKDFRDEEYTEPKALFDQAGFEVVIASNGVRPCRGRFGLEVPSELQFENINVLEFDALVLVGGSGAQQYFRDPMLHQVSQDFNQAGKLIAAICIAPTILANAGLLKGRKVTAYSSEEQVLRFAGVTWSRLAVEIDENIITANGPQSSKEFGEKIVEVLKSKP